MKRKHGMVLVSALAMVLVLAAGIGYAFAQEPPQGQPQQGQLGPGGPGGPGGRGGFMPPGQRGRLLAGEVVKVEDNTITLKTRRGEEKAVKVDDKTRYRKKDGQASLEDVKPGEKVGVRLAKAEEGAEPTAKLVLIRDPQGGRPHPTVGEITRIEDDTITINTAEGEKQVKIPALTQGMRVAVVTGEDGTAKVVIYNPPERAEGMPGGGQAPPGEQAPPSPGGEGGA